MRNSVFKYLHDCCKFIELFFHNIKKNSVSYTVKFYVTGVEDEFSLMDIIQIQ